MISNTNSKFFFYLKLPPLPTCSQIMQNPINGIANISTMAVSDATAILWKFDNILSDLSNVYNGSSMNSAPFISPDYAGYGSALSLNGHNQYVIVSGPYVNFSYTPFTVEAWIYPQSLSPSQDYVIFSQCTSPSRRLCLILMIRDSSLRMAFWDDDCQSSATVTANQWHHVAYVYDYPNRSKRVYLNGELVCINTTSSPYEGSNGAIYIGVGNPNGFWAWWNGYIDQLSIVYRAKNGSEVRDDATLVVYYSFDDPGNVERDLGALGKNGTIGTDVSSSSNGHINRCLNFSGVTSNSFFRITGLTRLGIQNYSYSISLLLKPIIVNSGTIIYLSSNWNGTGWCRTLLGFSSTGQLVSSIPTTNSLMNMTAMILPINAWTHIVSTYSSANGLRLYINGTLFGSINGFTHSATGQMMTLTLGHIFNGSNCTSAVAPIPYQGLLDEFRLYSRELTQSDVCLLSS